MFKKAVSHPPSPTRAETRACPWRGRSERGGVNPLHPRRATGTQDVEPLSDAIDPLHRPIALQRAMGTPSNGSLAGGLFLRRAQDRLHHPAMAGRP